MFDSMWHEASRDVEAENATRALTTAKVAASSVWPFLAAAESVEEFDLRVEYAMDRLSSLAGDQLDSLVAALRDDYLIMQESPDFPKGQQAVASLPASEAGTASYDTCHSCGKKTGENGSYDRQGWPYCPDCKHKTASGLQNTDPMDEATAEENVEPETGLDHMATEGVLSLYRIATATGDKYIVVDKASGRKVGGPFSSRPEAEQAIANGKFKGKSVTIKKADDAHPRDRGGQRDQSGGTVRRKEKTPKAHGNAPKTHANPPKAKAASKVANAAQDSCEKCKQSPGWHADLHADHTWTNTACPAYRTMDGADCTCNKKKSTKTAAGGGPPF